MGKPLRVSVSLSTTLNNSENRICTRSTTTAATVHLPSSKIKFDDLKPSCVSHKKAWHNHHRTPMLGKTNLPMLASSAQHQQLVTTTATIKHDEAAAAAAQKKPSHSQHPTTPGSHYHLETPAFREVGRVDPLRSTPRLNDEICTDEAYLKRHEKHEKQEKAIKRRDRIWRREEEYRLHLMKISRDERPPKSPPKLLAVEVVSRGAKSKRHR